MGRKKIRLSEDVLRSLYINQGWSPAKIGERYSCNAITIRSRLIEAGIPLKTKSAAQNRYRKHDFAGSDTDKAYMLGFKYGDLNAYRPSPVSETVIVRSHTTHPEQARLFERLFAKYGKITTSKTGRNVQQACYLNNSFLFLMDKYPPKMRRWLSTRNELSWAFAAGYIDAEGTFGLNQGRGRFKIDAYDKAILEDLHELFIRAGINSKTRIIARKGENDYGWKWKSDLWRVSVNTADSLVLLINHLDPYLRHERRIAAANIVMKNIDQRKKHGTIK